MRKTTTPRYGVVIIHYANLAHVRQAINSVLATLPPGQFHPIIVDNSAQQSAAILQTEYGARITVLKLDRNEGFSGGNNAGIRWAWQNLDGEAVILLNDDAVVAADTLPILVQTLADRPAAAQVVPKIYFTAGHEFHPGYEPQERGRVLWYAGGLIDWREVVGFHRGVDEVDRGQYDTPAPTPFATGCCVAIRRQDIAQYGALDERYFLYWEDVEWSQRFWRAGREVWYEPTAVAWHQNAGSSGSGSDLHRYYQTRNRFLFGGRYAPWRAKLFLAKQLWQLYQQGTSPQKRAILDVITSNYGFQPLVHPPQA